MKIEMMVGEVYKTNNYGDLRVVEYIDSRNVIAEFINTGYHTTTRAMNIREGKVKDPMAPVIHGVGYIGAVAHKAEPKSYKTWISMIHRCYCQKSLRRNPTYEGCSVSKDWHNFQNFAKWFEHNHKDGYQLDKDLLVVGNRVYSQETCIFVPSKINSFVSDVAAKRGDNPVGVYYNIKCNKYRASCSDGGIKKHLGYFIDPNQAYLAWRDYKLQIALRMKLELDEIDKRIYPNIVTIIYNTR